MVHGAKASFKWHLIRTLGLALISLELGWFPLSASAAPVTVINELGCFLPFSIGVLVTVTNEGLAPVSSLKISFTDGEKTLAKLDPGRAQMFRIKPSDSGIILSFVDTSGNLHSQEIDVYLEKNYYGTIDIKIDRFSKITWREDITWCPN